MPIYELKCSQCGHEFEDLVSSYDTVADVECEKCSSKSLELKPSLVAGNLPVCGSCASSSTCSTSAFT